MAPRRPLDPDTDENFAQLLKTRDALERSLAEALAQKLEEKEGKTKNRFEMARFGWGVLTALVTITLWLGRLSWSVGDHEKQITELKAFEVWGREAKAKNDLDLQDVRNRLSNAERNQSPTPPPR
jgi:hypothetical protein